MRGRGRRCAAPAAQLEATYARLATAHVTPAELADLERDPAVLDVRPPMRPVPDAISEGRRRLERGRVARVGVHGPGRQGRRDRLGLQGLARVTNLGCANRDVSSHGTAVAHVVQEMAPNATLFRYCVDDEVGLADAALRARDDGVRVIVQSLSWFNGSRGDSASAPSGSPDATAATARANGILWVNSAGNFAQRHSSGSYSDADADGWLEFAPGDEGNSLRIPVGGEVCVYLKWDRWPATDQNFDLHLWNQMGSTSQDQVSTGTPMPSRTPRQSSKGGQSGTERPTEQLCYTNSTGAGDYFIAIQRTSATQTPRFDLFITAYDLQYQERGGQRRRAGDLACCARRRRRVLAGQPGRVVQLARADDRRAAET